MGEPVLLWGGFLLQLECLANVRELKLEVRLIMKNIESWAKKFGFNLLGNSVTLDFSAGK